MTLRITDHALVRFLERAGGLDVEALRAHLAVSLERAEEAAKAIGQSEYTINAGGMRYFVREGRVVTLEAAVKGRYPMNAADSRSEREAS